MSANDHRQKLIDLAQAKGATGTDANYKLLTGSNIEQLVQHSEVGNPAVSANAVVASNATHPKYGNTPVTALSGADHAQFFNLYEVDGTFEDGSVGGWVALAGADVPVIDTNFAWEGSNSLHCVRNLGTGSNYAQRIFPAGVFPENGWYWLSLRQYIPSTDLSGVKGIRLGGSALTASNYINPKTDEWHQFVVNFHINDRTGSIVLYTLGDAASAESWIDNIYAGKNYPPHWA